MAQLVEHILGKDEVPGSNPGSSSRQPRRYAFGALVLYTHFERTQYIFEGLYGAATLAFGSRFARIRTVQNPVRIPRPKIGELALQAEGVGSQ